LAEENTCNESYYMYSFRNSESEFGGLEFGELKFGELKFGEMERNRSSCTVILQQNNIASHEILAH